MHAPESELPAFIPYVGEDPSLHRIDVTTLGDLLLKAFDEFPDQRALVFPDSTWTYRELVTRAMRTARGLIALGVKPRDHVGILMPTGPELVEIFFAVALCGATGVLINARYKSAELAYVIENADIITLLTTDQIAEQVDFVERIGAALPELAASADPRNLRLEAAPKLRSVILAGSRPRPGYLPLEQLELLAAQVPETEVHRNRVRTRVRDVCMILYTSGTTSNPKGCLLSHEAMVRTSIVLGKHRFRLTHQDKMWSPLPLFHIAAMLPLVAAFSVGATYLGMQHFEPGLSLDMIDRNGVTMIFAPFVTFLQAMALHPKFATTDFSQVRLMNSCFAVQPKSVSDAYRRAMPHTLQLGTYGMTEAAGIVATGHESMDRELGFTRLGVPLIGVDVRIADPVTNEECATGTRGEICLKGYSVFDGYYRDEEKNRISFDDQGWFHTGDLGSIDAEGHMMFDGRTKDMLKVGGENVAAAEIEAHLTRHPAVKLAQVVGIPDPKYVEIPVAFVELFTGHSASAEELIAFCSRDISSFKVPRFVRFVVEWPMSASKIQKYQLRARMLKELGLSDDAGGPSPLA
jgi:acyl-CoA synthetase (AMP-forming)/AMP-acid ligase II